MTRPNPMMTGALAYAAFKANPDDARYRLATVYVRQRLPLDAHVKAYRKARAEAALADVLARINAAASSRAAPVLRVAA